MLTSAMRSLCCTCFPFIAPRVPSPALRRTTRATLSSSSKLAGTTGVLKMPDVASLISAPDCKLVVMIGAGMSVSAGIPDFRTPGTGLYDNLQEYGLPYAEAIFDLDFYCQNPKPFQRLCRELWPGNFKPTPAHAFLKVLHDKQKLARAFTQNIDSLEAAAGLPSEAVVAAHGNFDSASVVSGSAAGRDVPIDQVRTAAFGGDDEWTALAQRHGGLVKPDIVFFGEQLPMRFFERAREDLPAATLLLVLGTSLAVQPFASLVGMTRPGVPRLLINRERVGEHMPGGFDFSAASNAADGFYEGDCDDAARELCDLLGWGAELEAALTQAAEASEAFIQANRTAAV